MAKFRKKPVVIEAEQWFRNGDHSEDGPSNKEGQIVRRYRNPNRSGEDICDHHRCIFPMSLHGWIDTLEGGHVVCPGDWIITGIKGEKYPCKPDIFEATYEEILEGE